jgi:hypothetical protein
MAKPTRFNAEAQRSRDAEKKIKNFAPLHLPDSALKFFEIRCKNLVSSVKNFALKEFSPWKNRTRIVQI